MAEQHRQDAVDGIRCSIYRTHKWFRNESTLESSTLWNYSLMPWQHPVNSTSVALHSCVRFTARRGGESRQTRATAWQWITQKLNLQHNTKGETGVLKGCFKKTILSDSKLLYCHTSLVWRPFLGNSLIVLLSMLPLILPLSNSLFHSFFRSLGGPEP